MLAADVLTHKGSRSFLLHQLLFFSLLVMSDVLQPHGLQHTRLPCSSLSPKVCSDSCPLSWWCHPIISSSVVPFSSCPQYFPASGSFPVILALLIRWPKYWSFSISPSDEYSGFISFRIDWFDLFAVQGTLKSLLQLHSLKVSVLPCSAFGAQSIWSHGPKPCLTQWNYEPCCVGPPKMDGSWWRVLTNRCPLEKGMANHFSIPALRTPWTVWKYGGG